MENPKHLLGYAPHTVMDGASFLEHKMNGEPCNGVWLLLKFEKTGSRSYVCQHCGTSVSDSSVGMFEKLEEEHVLGCNKRITLNIKIRDKGHKLTINGKELNINEQDPSTDFYNLKFDGYKFDIDGETFVMHRQSGGWMIFHHRKTLPEGMMPDEILDFDDQEYSTITIQIAC